MKIREVMKEDIKSLLPDMPVKDALDLIFKMRISGLPVIDKDGKLLGCFTEKDVLKIILPSYLSQVGGFIYEDNPKNIKKKFTMLSELKIIDLVSKDAYTIDDGASLSEAARIMLVKDIRRIPVLNKSKKIVGIVARCDILKALKKMADDIYLGGLSTGATLSILHSLQDESIRGLFLFSPAVKITDKARFACWLTSL